MPCRATRSSGRYAVVSVTTAVFASAGTERFYHFPLRGPERAVPRRPTIGLVGKTLVTGGSGFLGSHVVRALAARGDDIRLLVRRGSELDHLADLEFERVSGDVMDRRAVARAMKDTQRVFHIAGTTSMLSRHREKVFDLNVRGTRIVLEESLAAGVERVVFTSSVAAIGPAK